MSDYDPVLVVGYAVSLNDFFNSFQDDRDKDAYDASFTIHGNNYDDVYDAIRYLSEALDAKVDIVGDFTGGYPEDMMLTIESKKYTDIGKNLLLSGVGKKVLKDFERIKNRLIELSLPDIGDPDVQCFINES